MKLLNLFLLAFIGFFGFYNANAALDSTAEGCSKTFVYCGTYSFYTDIDGNQFTVFVSDNGEFIEKCDGHLKLTTNYELDATGFSLGFVSESQFVYASSFVGKAFALDIDDNIIDSLDIDGNWARGIGAFDAPFYRLKIVDNFGNTYWNVSNAKKDVPTIPINEPACKPVFQYTQSDGKIYVTVDEDCNQNYKGMIVNLQTGETVVNDISISTGINDIPVVTGTGCYNLILFKTSTSASTTTQSNPQTRRGVGVSGLVSDVLSKIADSHKFCL